MRFALSAALAAALATAAAPAQEPSWSAEGRLEDRDSQDADERRYDEHRVRLEAGRRYRLTVASDDFDTILRLIAPNGEAVAENDDSGDSLNSRITYAPEQSGDYTLRVVGFSAEARGAYRLAAAPAPDLPAPIGSPGTRVPASGFWTLREGNLGTAGFEIDGRRYDDYLVRFQAGERRLIMVESEAFDPVLQILTPQGRDADPPEALDGDDDTGVATNALLGFSPETSGDYVVRVFAFGAEPGGPYRLWISE
ncbi:MAG: PPC domain-containing protein [Pseudomonadota bacterium]|nr:PPC domain-containing protein [Pseudomonadota bacterium]